MIKPVNRILLKRHYKIDQNLSDVGNYKRVLILAPHADDETIGAGGTLRLHANQGAEVSCLVLTDGAQSVTELSKGDLVQARKDEMEEVKNILGLKEVFYLDLEDGGVSSTSQTRDLLWKVIQKLKPDLIYSPPFIDAHQDHLATTKLLAETLAEGDYECDIRLYEVNCPIPPSSINIVTDISNTLDAKEEAIKAFESQTIAFSGFIELAKIKGSANQGQSKTPVETFLHMKSKEFIKRYKRLPIEDYDFSKIFKQVNRSETLLWAIYKNYKLKEKIYNQIKGI